MGQEIASLFVELTAKTDKFMSDIKKAEAQGSGTADKLGKAALGIGVAVGAAGVALGAYMLKAGDDLDAADKKLATAANASKVSMASIDPVLQKARGALEAYGYSNANVTDQMATLTEAHVPLNDQLQVMQGAANLAAARHIDLAEALKAELMAAQGSGKALKEYGINLPPTIDGAKALANAQTALQKAQENLTIAVHDHGEKSKQAETAQQKLADAQAKVSKITEEQANHFAGLQQTMDAMSVFNGQAAAHADTLQGKIEVLHAKFTDWSAAMSGPVQGAANAFLGWITDDAIPAVERFAREAWPLVQHGFAEFIEAWKSGIYPALKDVAGAFNTLLLTPMLQLGADVLPPLTHALQFLGDNLDHLVPILEGAAAGWVAYKAAMIGESVIAGASKAWFAMQLVLDGVTVSEAAATVGAKGLSNALTALSLNPMIVVATGIAAAVAATLSIAKGRQETIDGLNDMANKMPDFNLDNSVTGIQNLNSQLDQEAEKLMQTQNAAANLSTTFARFGAGQQDFIDQIGKAGQTAQDNLKKLEIPKEVAASWNDFSPEVQSGLTDMAKNVGITSPAFASFYATLRDNGDVINAIENVTAASTEQKDTMLANALAIANRDLITWQALDAQYLKTAQSMGLSGQAAINWANNMANRADPAGANATGTLQKLATAMGGTVDEAQAFINKSPAAAAALLAQYNSANQAAGAYSRLFGAIGSAVQAGSSLASVPGFQQKLGQGKLMASGGVVRGGSYTLATIGEDEDEIVLPKSKAGPSLWSAAMAALGGGAPQTQTMAPSMMVGGGGGGVNIGSIIVQDSNRPGQTAKEIRDMLIEWSRQNGGLSILGGYA